MRVSRSDRRKEEAPRAAGSWDLEAPPWVHARRNDDIEHGAGARRAHLHDVTRAKPRRNLHFHHFLFKTRALRLRRVGSEVGSPRRFPGSVRRVSPLPETRSSLQIQKFFSATPTVICCEVADKNQYNKLLGIHSRFFNGLIPPFHLGPVPGTFTATLSSSFPSSSSQ